MVSRGRLDVAIRNRKCHHCEGDIEPKTVHWQFPYSGGYGTSWFNFCPKCLKVPRYKSKITENVYSLEELKEIYKDNKELSLSYHLANTYEVVD